MAGGQALLLGLVILALFVIIHTAPSSSVEVKCGQLTCEKNQYCSEIENQCASCTSICDQKLHNYDAALCMENCLGYLHDSDFVSKDDFNTVKKQLAEQGQTINTLIILFSVSVVLFIILGSIWIYKCSKKNEKFGKVLRAIRSRLTTIPKTSSQNQIPPELGTTRITTVSSQTSDMNDISSSQRQAAEDSPVTHAYNNMAMAATPSPNANSARQPI